MTDKTPAEEAGRLTPWPGSERIETLDAVRGVALIGIFAMNVEFFNRPLSELGQGLPAGLAGGDWLAGWLVYTFIQGKFWTMFSLLFGIGFALMLRRARQAGRAFLPAYLRRIAALAVFGILHHVFVWGGDILFSYALGAVGLLVVLYARVRYLGLALMLLLALGGLPRWQWASQAEGPLAMLAIAAVFLRDEVRLRFLGRDRLAISVLFVLLGLATLVATFGCGLVALGDQNELGTMSVLGAAWLVFGWLSSRFHGSVHDRARNAGVGLYLASFILMTAFGVVDFLFPGSASHGLVPETTASVRTTASRAPRAFANAPEKIAGVARLPPEARELQWRSAEETRVLSHGTYPDAVRFRAREFVRSAPGEAGFATTLVGMFLIGTWFVRSRVIEQSTMHLQLFRKLASIGVPMGVGMGMLSSVIATASSPGLAGDPYVIASGLALMGNLPACLGYVGVIVLLLHSRAGSVVAGLAPLGQMSLSNYLVQSIVASLFFYGYGFGNWGMGRGLQLVFVCVVIAAQLVFCQWWLARFRYGPMEWLWRAITYWRLPPLRRASPILASAAGISASA